MGIKPIRISNFPTKNPLRLYVYVGAEEPKNDNVFEFTHNLNLTELDSL